MEFRFGDFVTTDDFYNIFGIRIHLDDPREDGKCELLGFDHDSEHMAMFDTESEDWERGEHYCNDIPMLFGFE